MTHDNIKTDSLRDLKLDTDRQVGVGGDGDLSSIHGLRVVQQSTMLVVGNEIRDLIGETMTAEAFAEVTSRVRRALQDDPQLENVRKVEIDEIDKQTNTVTFEVFVGLNNSFELPVTV